MGVIIGGFAWLGNYLDKRQDNVTAWWTLGLTLFGVGSALYLMIKEVIKMGKEEDSPKAYLKNILREPKKYINDDMLKELDEQPELMCRGGSVIISPLGKVLAGPLYEQEGILFADLDLGAIARSKFDFDVVGHYARPDVFQLTVNEKPSISVVAVDKK